MVMKRNEVIIKIANLGDYSGSNSDLIVGVSETIDYFFDYLEGEGYAFFDKERGVFIFNEAGDDFKEKWEYYLEEEVVPEIMYELRKGKNWGMRIVGIIKGFKIQRFFKWCEV